MRSDRVVELANHFLYDYTRHDSNEYDQLDRMERRLREFEREVRGEAIEAAAAECEHYVLINKGDAADAAVTLASRIRNLKRG